jgi:cytochrome c-type biogenesis protein CcmE
MKQKRNYLIGVIGIGFVIIAALGIYFITLDYDKANIQKSNTELSEILDFDDVVKNPERFKGSIGIVGRVINLDESNASFILSCEDGDTILPVTYEGQMPELDSEITVYGEIKELESGKYIFEGHKFKKR